MPYSETFSPIRTAFSRMATLCSFDPVRCCSRLPKLAGGTIRSSTRVPSWATAVTPASPRDGTSATHSWSTKASIAVTRLVTAATRSMSLAVSPNRRRLPAISQRSTARQASSSDRARSASGSRRATDGPPARAAARVAERPSRIAVSVLMPSPGRARTRCSSAAWRTSPTVCRSSSAKIRLAVFGPTPWIRITATAPGGLRASSCVNAEISPVSISSATLSAIVWPMPGRLVSLPCSDSRSTDSGVSFSVLRRTTVGEHAVDDRALEFEQVGHQVETVGDVGVCERVGHPRVIIPEGGTGYASPPCRTSSFFPPTTSATTSRRWWLRSPRCECRRPLPATCWWSTTTPRTAPASIADELAREHDWVHVLHRPGKQGLGQAYIAGFRWALERDYSHILEMDCDLSPSARGDPPPARGGRGQRPGAGLALRAPVAGWSAGRRTGA